MGSRDGALVRWFLLCQIRRRDPPNLEFGHWFADGDGAHGSGDAGLEERPSCGFLPVAGDGMKPWWRLRIGLGLDLA